MEAEAVVAEFEKACGSAVALQEELLTEILVKNGTCDYLQKYGSPTSLESFKSQVPLVSYNEIAQEIQQIADLGNLRPILCNDPIVQFAISSGTSSGKHKLIPQTSAAYAANSIKAYQTTRALRNKFFPLESSNPVLLSLSYCGKQYKSKSGILIGAVSTNHYKSEAYKHESANQTSPKEIVVAGADWRQTTYCHLLCGILQRHRVEIIFCLFAYTLCEAMRLLEAEWKDICEDILTGSLNTKIKDEMLRSSVSEVLQRELESQDSAALAEELRGICSSVSWHGILQRIWPRAKYVNTVVTGAMQPYVPALRKYAGDLPLVGLDYGSSEGYFGINLNPAALPEEVIFTLVPYSVYFEFLPVQGDEGSIVGIGEVEPGKQYELVITTSQGLYRYKVGDVVKVVGFLQESPQVAFSHRQNAVLNIHMDRVDEQELQQVVLGAAGDRVEIVNFTSYVKFDEPPHYQIFWELKNSTDGYEDELLEECCGKLDRSFNVNYLMGRVSKTIGALELVVVKHGAFVKLMEKAVEGGASPSQYKTPRCVTTVEMLELLEGEKIKSYRSSLDVPSDLVEAWEPSFP